MPFRPPNPDWAKQFALEIRRLDRSPDDEAALAVAVQAWPSTLLLPPAQAAAQVMEAQRRRQSRAGIDLG